MPLAHFELVMSIYLVSSLLIELRIEGWPSLPATVLSAAMPSPARLVRDCKCRCALLD